MNRIGHHVLRLALAFVVAALLAACATPATPPPTPEHLLHDELFAPSAEPVDPQRVFALNDAMRRYLTHDIAPLLRRHGTQDGLIKALYTKGHLKLEYDATHTRNAAEAFEARAGNCLSLVIMTAALAKELGMPVRYQSAYLEETWSRSGRFLLRSAHVNVTLGPRIGDRIENPFTSPLTIDFLPPDEIRGLRTREIPESTIVAMYMNNRAVETLLRGRVDDAYAWVRGAIRQDPTFLGAINTLGLVYLRRDHRGHAAAAFDHVVKRDPYNTRALANLAETLRQLGRVDEADALQRRLAQIEPQPPFHFFNLGKAALERGDYRAARDYFAKEVARAEYYHEFHFWLGVANYRLGHIEQAKKHLLLALEQSPTRSEHDLYAAKLAHLRIIEGAH